MFLKPSSKPSIVVVGLFFWTGDDVCHGSKCLVAWDSVQATKNNGGLGVKDLELQNRCLLMRFINKLFVDDHPSWKSWILRDMTPFDSTSPGSYSYIWRIISDELDTYRSITYVNVNNGASTSFWLDHWLPDGPLRSTHEALFSHTLRPNVSVQYVLQNELDLRLRPRLTNAASSQLGSLLQCLQGITLGDGADTRLVKLTGKPYSPRAAYAALDNAGDVDDRHGCRIWSTRLPNKVKIFAWLYFKDRLSSRVNLHAKHVVDNEQCLRCNGAVETRRHIFFECRSSSALWRVTKLGHVGLLSDDEIWSSASPAGLNPTLWPFVLLTMLWRIWDSRSGEVFRSKRSNHMSILASVCNDLLIWRKRLPDNLVGSLDAWRKFLIDCTATSMS